MSIKGIIQQYCLTQRWTLGFSFTSLQDVVSQKAFCIQYLKNQPHDRWFADPFILDYNEKEIVLLVEEYCYKVGVGRIAKLIVNRSDFKLISCETLLEVGSHLSFPAVERKDDGIFIYPENAKGLGLARYRIDDEKGVEFVETISNKPLADAVITDLFGENLMFCTQIPQQNGRVLSVYKFVDSEPVLLTECIFPSNIARNAGDWFKIGSKVYRPAQDCNGGYGKAIIIQQVERLDETSFSFKDICRIQSTNLAYTTGCHTFNSRNGLIVVDVHGYLRNWASKLYWFLRRIFK